MQSPIRVVQIGLGPLGRMLTPSLCGKTSLSLVGAVDIDPAVVGKDIGELTGQRRRGIAVSLNLVEAMAGGADVAVIATVSSLKGIVPTLHQALGAGLDVVSTCEELSFPWTSQPGLASEIDTAARAAGKSVLGTGVNPGFLMDFLPVAASAVCGRVHRVLVERIQDASLRRLPFRQKIGAGLSVEEFGKLVDAGKIRHVGLTESMHLIASRLGWSIERTTERVDPVIAQEDVAGDGWRVAAGAVTGVHQTGQAFAGGAEVIRLEFQAAVGQSSPRDTITLAGDRDYVVTIPGGTPGDAATCAIIANAIPVVRAAPPGLRTMADLPPISAIP